MRALPPNPPSIRIAVLIFAVLPTIPTAAQVKSNSETVERWGIFELELRGPSGGNPFVDVQLSGEFRQGERVYQPEGFYDGNGIYRIRFMPDAQGEWSYVTRSNRSELDGKTGRFTCVRASPSNHGPVHVHRTWYLAYADGTAYFQIGTTCYAWAHQGSAMEEKTLATLKDAPFNKMRMCVFPKSYAYNKNEPEFYPFEGTPLTDWDYSRFNPEFFRHFEKRLGDLRDLGIEADLILFHPYDRWGYAKMNAETNDRYLRYVVARLAAYRNVWWSFANEYDLMKSKTMADWDRFFQIVRKYDPYNHMRGIHNCRSFYDHTKPWVTHASIQSSDLASARKWRDQYKKPIIYDECKYEGNIPQGWGNITAEEMVNRFWMGTIAGCYVGHGETYKHPKDILWWSKGGVLHGQSPSRIAFLKKIMEPTPFDEMVPGELAGGNYTLSKEGELYFVYSTQSEQVNLDLPGPKAYKVDGIDTWNMTITSFGSASPGKFRFTLPKPNYLLRLSVYGPGEEMRPQVKASASPTEGIVPLKVQFSASTDLRCKWRFGDGSHSSEKKPVHIYQEPGLYTVMLTVTDKDGLSSSMPLGIAVDRDDETPIVRIGLEHGESTGIELHGKIRRGDDGSYDFGDGEPWKWISVGDGPTEALEGLRSFTILGWANPTSTDIGSGGNRIAFNLQYNHSGFDLVHLKDGRLRLAVNEWPDGVRNDSSPNKLRVGKWTFFAVTYDGTKQKDNVRWYFGDADRPAELDKTVSYWRGPTGKGSGTLTIGNYNESIQQHGKDRQFRGRLRGIEIFGSRIGPRGALSLSDIHRCQQESK
jgi:PKD repeat protein